MANPWLMKIGLAKEEPRRQILPKDILVHARMFSGEEAEKQIMDAVKKHSFYSHSRNTSQWMQHNSMIGSTSTAWAATSWPMTSFSTYAMTTVWQ